MIVYTQKTNYFLCFAVSLFIYLFGNGQVKPNNSISPASAQIVNTLPANYSPNLAGNFVKTWTVKKPSNNVSDVQSSARPNSKFL